ncbi:MAG: hypothetical protein K0U66_10560, partial [Gammaproteobacteria bacterium]|nr:hypothetical protein [Gammaproteobacteria bacterium]
CDPVVANQLLTPRGCGTISAVKLTARASNCGVAQSDRKHLIWLKLKLLFQGLMTHDTQYGFSVAFLRWF